MTTTEIIILEMIKAVLKADILWACSASAVSTCRRRRNRGMGEQGLGADASLLLAKTGGMFEQQRRQTGGKPDLPFVPLNSPQKGFYTGLLWPPLTSSLFLRLALCSWKALTSPSDWLCSLAVFLLKLWQTGIPCWVSNNSATVRCTKRRWECSLDARP